MIVKAPSSTAVVAPPGMPRDRVGTKLAFAAVLLALSGEATPSIAPRPKLCLFFAEGEETDHDLDDGDAAEPFGAV